MSAPTILTAQSAARAALAAHEAGSLCAQATVPNDGHNFYRRSGYGSIGCAIGVAITEEQGLLLEQRREVGGDGYLIKNILPLVTQEELPHQVEDIPQLQALQSAHDAWAYALLNSSIPLQQDVEQAFLTLAREMAQ